MVMQIRGSVAESVAPQGGDTINVAIQSLTRPTGYAVKLDIVLPVATAHAVRNAFVSRRSIPDAYVAPQSLAGCLGSDNVDDDIPTALHGEDQRGSIVETEVDLVRVSKRIAAINAGRDLDTVSFSPLWK